MAEQRLERHNFSAGELSPWRRSASQHATHANGVALARRFVVTAEGNLTRGPGTRFLRALKTEAALGRLLAFRYTGADNYTLVLNGGAIRFIRAGGFVLDGGTPYEVPMPWAASDLDDLRIAQEGSTAWITCPGFEPRTLIRGASHTAWTLAEYRPTGGPVKTQNLDTTKTVLASATTGAGITLTGVNTGFSTASHAQSVMRIDESDLSLVPNWKAEETLTLPTEAVPSGGATNIGSFSSLANAFDGDTGTAATLASGSGYIGRTPAAATTIATARVRGSAAASGPGAVPPLTFTLYGKTGSAPASATDGTVLATVVTLAAGGFDTTLISDNFVTAYDHIWLRANGSGIASIAITELDLVRYTVSAVPVLRRYNGNVYEAISGANAGLTPPTHSEGDVLSEAGGIYWRYRHGPYGLIRITAVAGATSATATVLKRLPDSVAQRASYRFSEGAWNATDGWPDKVLLVDGGLFFARGDDWWKTTVANPDDFEQTALATSAIAARLRGNNGSLPQIEWALDNGVIVLGLRDGEVVLRAPAALDPLTAANVRAVPASGEGSASHSPAMLEGGVVWIGRTRERLHFAAFDQDTTKLAPVHVSKHGRHLLKGKAASLAWQQDPHRILWVACQDGTLAGLTLWIEEKILAMHSHPFTNGSVEDVCAMPSSDEGVSEVTLIVRRTIDGATRRYVEQFAPFFEAASSQTDVDGTGDADKPRAWYFDCALEYSGVAVASITGLSHLEGEEVAVQVNGTYHPRRTVASGAIALARADVTHALVGLPVDARVTDLPRNAQAQNSAGRRKVASHAQLDLVETIGGTMSVNGGRAEPLQLTGSTVMAVPQLFSGSVRRHMTGSIEDEATITLIASDGFPMTVAGLSPDIDVLEDG